MNFYVVNFSWKTFFINFQTSKLSPSLSVYGIWRLEDLPLHLLDKNLSRKVLQKNLNRQFAHMRFAWNQRFGSKVSLSLVMFSILKAFVVSRHYAHITAKKFCRSLNWILFFVRMLRSSFHFLGKPEYWIIYDDIWSASVSCSLLVGWDSSSTLSSTTGDSLRNLFYRSFILVCGRNFANNKKRNLRKTIKNDKSLLDKMIWDSSSEFPKKKSDEKRRFAGSFQSPTRFKIQC